MEYLKQFKEEGKIPRLISLLKLIKDEYRKYANNSFMDITFKWWANDKLTDNDLDLLMKGLFELQYLVSEYYPRELDNTDNFYCRLISGWIKFVPPTKENYPFWWNIYENTFLEQYINFLERNYV